MPIKNDNTAPQVHRINETTEASEVDAGIFHIWQDDGEGGTELVVLSLADFSRFCQIYERSRARDIIRKEAA